MKICNSCGNENGDNAKFCVECGEKLQDSPKFCPECGTELVNQPKFCPECGTKINNVVSNCKSPTMETKSSTSYSLGVYNAIVPGLTNYGGEVEFAVKDSDLTFRVFTTRVQGLQKNMINR